MEIRIGRVTHYFSRLGVAGVHVEADGLKIGDIIRIKGHTTDLTQPVESMQLEHETIQEAKPGMDIGLKVQDHVREHDIVFKIVQS
ncbi:MAG: hypothetical protein K6T99_00010 [Armatimonadetes bacterium]|nr:hypothetical protein [Armatimonadota bacterium]